MKHELVVPSWLSPVAPEAKVRLLCTKLLDQYLKPPDSSRPDLAAVIKSVTGQICAALPTAINWCMSNGKQMHLHMWHSTVLRKPRSGLSAESHWTVL